MKKSKRKLVMFIAVLLCISFTMVACDEASPVTENTTTQACDHNWNAPTCTTPKTCSQCGLTNGSPVEHTWSNATCTTPQICTACGLSNGSLAGHSWSSATCITLQTCSVCGQTNGSFAGHSWNNATCTAAKTCTVCEVTSGSPLDHSWSNATCTAPQTCSVCGQTSGSPLDHSWHHATCATPQTCTVCGLTVGSPVPHDYRICIHNYTIDSDTSPVYTFGDTFNYKSYSYSEEGFFQITIGDDYSLTWIIDEDSDYNYEIAVRIPITVKNIGNEYAHFNRYECCLYDSAGMEARVSYSFDDGLGNGLLTSLEPGESISKAVYILYDVLSGDGDNHIVFDNGTDDIIVVKLPIGKRENV